MDYKQMAEDLQAEIQKIHRMIMESTVADNIHELIKARLAILATVHIVFEDQEDKR